MFPPLINIHKKRILQHLAIGMFVSAIADVENVSERVVKKIRNNINVYKTHIAFSTISFNYHYVLIGVMHHELKDFLKTKSWTYLKKIQHYLFDK